MTSAIDDLLADSAIPPTQPRAFDVAAALRRLATDAALASPASEVLRASQAGQRLGVVSRWVLNGPGAAIHVDRLAEGPEGGVQLTEEQMDVEGALVFACLLYLTGHPESAQFWWQLAAGAGHRGASYCLHLHHLELGEAREARHWYHQVTQAPSDTSAPDDAFLEGLELFARYVRVNGSAASAPTGGLEAEVDRLASRNKSCGIVSRPDRRLAERLHDFTARR
ncbi:hypothetical protein SLUN_36420 [Streptomyces lunaelactis]|uniref:Sel1 repeat family protein n=1 Tax=Streptomyces lunaelactis TaxID=1535768 RepID=A0A2R4TCL5_9ACTN|nr:hypothetical protein [Streptomyces lunaelactis]AVZ76854.1 hypothetical protein SLUN_36420 [Streptomyces lunaelactis]NUK38689.1 hypothetical protein [Streptomyces lunaelactis]NUK40460.1 hypothetical protein [Streptomyces lunaelactis]NUK50070.1 hypothetical protein [Streptomyces lunaelactis]NUK57140.1 hypothetical protein [Streptomyces lunaelactis]